jgi:hypothetical protein
VPDTGRQVHEIIPLDRHFFLPVDQRPIPLQDIVDLLLIRIGDDCARATWSDSKDAVADDRLESLCVSVPGAEDRPVYGGARTGSQLIRF